MQKRFVYCSEKYARTQGGTVALFAHLPDNQREVNP
jgi:hypothetical protein